MDGYELVQVPVDGGLDARLEVRTIDDTNHLTIGTPPRATAQIAQSIRTAAGAPR